MTATPPDFPREFEVVLASGARGRLACSRRTSGGACSWTLSMTGGTRKGGAWRASKPDALAAWLDAHSNQLAAVSAATLRERLALAPTIPVSSVSQGSFPATVVPEGAAEDAVMDSPQPPPPPPPPALECPLCSSYRSQASGRGLVRHLTTRHCGAALGDRGALALRGISRGICPCCSGLRSLWSKQCFHCLSVEPPRPARAADRITQPGRDQRAREARPGGASADGPMQATLPADWETRVRALPGNTLVHVPARFRERFAIAMAQGLEDLALGGLLEFGRSKLLMSSPPPEIPLRAELEERLRLWHDGHLEELLLRIEEQARCASERKGIVRGTRERRARKLAQAGAIRKGVKALTSSMAQLTPLEQKHWARELLPPSTAAEGGACPVGPTQIRSPEAAQDRGCAEPVDGADPAKPGLSNLRRTALGGVKFGALSGAGPSGTRPEHLQDALSVRRRSATSRLLRAVAKLVELGFDGSLPANAHWLTHSRLVFLRKPGSKTPRPIRVGEFWRRLVAKRLLAEGREDLQQLFVSIR